MAMAARATSGTLASSRRQSQSSPKAKPKAKSSLAPGRPSLGRPKARPQAAPPAPSAPRKDSSTQTELRLPSMSLRSVMRSGKSEKSERSDLLEMEDGSPMPFQLNVMKVDSGTTSGTSDDPRTPVRRNSWELSSLDPSTWPVFGITNEGIGITTNDGQTLDVEKSADFGFDRSLDGHQLASILEGIESGMLGDQSFTSPGNRNLEEMLAKAEEQNEGFRHLCWDLIALGRDLDEGEGFQEHPSHEQLLEEARRCLELVRERLDLRKQLEIRSEAVPEMEVPAPETNMSLVRGGEDKGTAKLWEPLLVDTDKPTGSLKLINPEPPGSCRLPSRSFSPTQPETRNLVASCSAPALPWSACCPVSRTAPLTPPLMPLQAALPNFQRTSSPQAMSRVGDSCSAQVTRFSSDGPVHGSSMQYPVEPVTRGVSPPREGLTTVSFRGYPAQGQPAGQPGRAAPQSGLPAFPVVSQRSPKWIGSWIRRSSCYEMPKVVRMSSFEGATQQC